MVSDAENGGDSSEVRHLRDELRDVRTELESVRARLLIATESEASLAERLEVTEEERAPEAVPQERARSPSQERAGAGDWSPSASVSASEPDLDQPAARDDPAAVGEPAAEDAPGDAAGTSARLERRSGERERGKVGADASAAGAVHAKSKADAETNGGEGGGRSGEKSANPLDDFFSQRPVASISQDDGRSGSPAARQRYLDSRERREVQELRRRSSRSRSRSGRPLARRDGFPQQRPKSEQRPTHSEEKGRSRHQDTLRSPSVKRRSPRNTQFSANAVKGEPDARIDTFCDVHGLQDRARIIMYNMNKDDLDVVLKEANRLKEANNPTGFIITRIRNIERRAGRPLGMKTHEHAPCDRRREVREFRDVRDLDVRDRDVKDRDVRDRDVRDRDVRDRDVRDRDVRDRGSPPRRSPQDGDDRFGRERDRTGGDDRQGAQGGFRSRSLSRRARQREEPPHKRFDDRR